METPGDCKRIFLVDKHLQTWYNGMRIQFHKEETKYE